MIRNKDVNDRLYLSQGDDTVYLDNCSIPQHHIEGIRFLYRQYRRFKKGVIINDPFSFGRNIQIILFLKAVRPLLKKSVLILCQEGGEHDWLERFHTWTDLYDDVTIESGNPTFKKQIIINAMVNLPVYCSREWSILIVDGENNTPTNLILKLPFKANFKIWNTSVNIKKHLDTFTAIFKWLFPTEEFDKNDFTPNYDSAVDIIEKSILLDSFMEDIVLRRDDLVLESSFESYQREVMPPPKPVTITSTATATITTINPTTITDTTTTITTLPNLTITRKNKDAAGTKIKRSKPKPNVAEESPHNKPPAEVLTTPIAETSKSCASFDSNEDFSIDNYEKKNVKNIINEPPYKIIEVDCTDKHSNLKLSHETDSLSGTMINKLEELDTLVFGHDLFIRKVAPNNNNKEFTCDNSTEPAKVVLTTTNKVSVEKNNSKPNSTITSDINSKTFDKSEADNNESVTITKKDNLSKDISNSDTENERLSIQLKDGDFTLKNFNELNEKKDDLGTNDQSEDVSMKKNGQDKNTDRPNDKIPVNPNELNRKRNKLDTQDTDQNTVKHINIDDKMKEYEEKVSKKFKGSLLDSLF